MSSRRSPSALVWLLASVVLLGAGAWCLVRGVEVRASTGGLLTTPVRQVRLRGGWLVGATAAIVAAVLVGLAGAGRLRRRR